MKLDLHFQNMFIKKKKNLYHQTFIVEWNPLTLKLIIFIIGLP